MEHRRDVQGRTIRASAQAALVEGRSQRVVAGKFGVSRETVLKMLQRAVPPSYQRQQPVKRPMLGPWWASSKPSFKTISRDQASKRTRPSNLRPQAHM